MWEFQMWRRWKTGKNDYFGHSSFPCRLAFPLPPLPFLLRLRSLDYRLLQLLHRASVSHLEIYDPIRELLVRLSGDECKLGIDSDRELGIVQLKSSCVHRVRRPGWWQIGECRRRRIGNCSIRELLCPPCSTTRKVANWGLSEIAGDCGNGATTAVEIGGGK
ncbi:hypothetical protein Droror1_Dr00013039 [Drosera rotundifolia]